MLEDKDGSSEVKTIPIVKEEDRLNIIILGPKESGKTTLANYLAQEQ